MPARATSRFHHDERRSARRVPVLFSALLNRRGWRSQIVEVLDLSAAGAKIQLRFQVPSGAEMILRMPGARRNLELPCAVANTGEEHGHPVAGLRFRVPDDVRVELEEIVERVAALRRASAAAAKSRTGPAARRAARAKRPGGATKSGAGSGGPAASAV
jgi:hypothetical protein